jgi:hypothetical protein
MLQFNPDWRFDTPSPIPQNVSEQFFALIGRCASLDRRHEILEHFKRYFAAAAGTTSNGSSSTSWAETDLRSYMSEAGLNAPLFIEAFYDGCQALPADCFRPNVGRINQILQETDSGWQIQLPHLVRTDLLAASIPVEEEPLSLDAQGRELIQNALSRSERFLADGENRQAVSEILWLLETISTAFQGMDVGDGTIEGRYFNKIASDLRRCQRGTTFDRVLEWMVALHGYLSSPTGGGVRHGIDINGGNEEVGPDDARLFCNLIRSYILYLLAEHRRLSSGR